jgi:hypothetical protein
VTRFGERKGANMGCAGSGQFSSRHRQMVLVEWHSPSRLGNAHRPGRGRPGVVENNNQGHRLEKGKSLEKRAPSRGGVKPGAGGISVSAARLLYPGRVLWSVKLDINDQPVGKGMELLVDDSYFLFDCITYTGKEACANCILRSPSSYHIISFQDSALLRRDPDFPLQFLEPAVHPPELIALFLPNGLTLGVALSDRVVELDVLRVELLAEVLRLLDALLVRDSLHD